MYSKKKTVKKVVSKKEAAVPEQDKSKLPTTKEYNEWLAGQDLLMLLEPEERYDLKFKVENISDPEEIVNKAEGGNKKLMMRKKRNIVMYKRMYM